MDCSAAGNNSHHSDMIRKTWVGDGDLQREMLGHEVNFEENWQIRNILLFQSHLDRTPKYVELASFPFHSP
jgi:2'-5' RNA ligase